MFDPSPQGRSREEVLRDALEAKQLMQSPLLKQFFSGSPEILTRAFVESTSAEQRETLWQEARGIEKLRVFLQTLADNGKHAEQEIAREETAREQARTETRN